MSTCNNARIFIGQTSQHILKSNGGDSDLMRFYCTTNKTTHGNWWSDCQEQLSCEKNVQSGFFSNNRISLYYSPSMDVCDNPGFGRVLKDNYESTTKKDYLGLGRTSEVNFTCNIPKNEDSGFTNQIKLHTPKQYELRALRMCSTDLPPRTTYLKNVHHKDPLEMQNNGRGPDLSLSETKERYSSHPIHPAKGNKLGVCEGGETKEGSGFFTNNGILDPITFKSAEAHGHELPPFMTTRPTGVSVMKLDYQPYDVENVGNSGTIPRVTCKSNLWSGFSKNNQPTDVKTCYEECFQRIEPPCTIEFTGDVCKKRTPSGFTSNRAGGLNILPFNTPGRFVTEYKYRYLDRTPIGIDREGHTWGKTLPLQGSGFSSDAKLHTANFMQPCFITEPCEQR